MSERAHGGWPQTAQRGGASEARPGPGSLRCCPHSAQGRQTPSSRESKAGTGDRRQQVAWQVSREVARKGHGRTAKGQLRAWAAKSQLPIPVPTAAPQRVTGPRHAASQGCGFLTREACLPHVGAIGLLGAWEEVRLQRRARSWRGVGRGSTLAGTGVDRDGGCPGRARRRRRALRAHAARVWIVLCCPVTASGFVCWSLRQRGPTEARLPAALAPGSYLPRGTEA